MAYVTTGTSGEDQAVVVVSDDEDTVIFFTPDQARRFAVQMIEKAHQIDHPVDESEWP